MVALFISSDFCAAQVAPAGNPYKPIVDRLESIVTMPSGEWRYHADGGRHEFTYSLYAHGGNWKDALTVRQGYELNYPLLPLQVETHSGRLPEQHSFLELTAENVVLTAPKKADDDGAIIFRFYE